MGKGCHVAALASGIWDEALGLRIGRLVGEMGGVMNRMCSYRPGSDPWVESDASRLPQTGLKQCHIRLERHCDLRVSAIGAENNGFVDQLACAERANRREVGR